MYHAYVTESQRELEQKILKELSPEKAYELVKKQVEIGERLSGTPEALKEVNLIRSVLEEYGIQSRILEFDAHISIPVETKLRVISPEPRDIEAIAFSWSVETPPEGIEGELLFVGFGKEEEYQSKDVRGKIVFASLGGGISRARKTEVCMGKGPKAFITFNNLQGGPIQKGTCKTAIGNPTPDILGVPYVPDIPVITIDNNDGLRIAEMCRQGLVRIWLKTRMDQGWKKTHLIEVNIAGHKEPEKFVMLAGHYDSWGPEGVTCNAVGVAAMLEFARVFNQYKENLKRSIRILFWGGHECGMGASGPWYIDNHWDEIQDNLVLYSFLDTVGMKDPSILLSYTSDELQPFYKDLINEVGLPPYMKKVVFGIPSGADIATFLMYACVPTNRDVAARDYGEYINRMDFMHTARDTLELAAPNMFETAFRTLAPMYLRFCNLPILPVDFSMGAEKLLNNLILLKKGGKNRIELESAIKYAEKLKKEYTNLYETGKNILKIYAKVKKPGSREFQSSFDVINKALIRLNKIMNRVLLSGFLKWDQYSSGLYFNALDATEIKSIPILEAIRKLDKLDHEGDEYGALLTRLVRNRNKVTDALKEAIEMMQRTRREVGELLTK
jgi:hypothetical protein